MKIHFSAVGFGGGICVCSSNISSLAFLIGFQIQIPWEMNLKMWWGRWELCGAQFFMGNVLWCSAEIYIRVVPKIKNILCVLLPWARDLLIQDPPLAPEHSRHNLVTLKANIKFCKVLVMTLLITTLAQTHPDITDIHGSGKIEEDKSVFISKFSFSLFFHWERQWILFAGVGSQEDRTSELPHQQRITTSVLSSVFPVFFPGFSD